MIVSSTGSWCENRRLRIRVHVTSGRLGRGLGSSQRELCRFVGSHGQYKYKSRQGGPCHLANMTGNANSEVQGTGSCHLAGGSEGRAQSGVWMRQREGSATGPTHACLCGRAWRLPRDGHCGARGKARATHASSWRCCERQPKGKGDRGRMRARLGRLSEGLRPVSPCFCRKDFMDTCWGPPFGVGGGLWGLCLGQRTGHGHGPSITPPMEVLGGGLPPTTCRRRNEVNLRKIW